MEFDNIATGMSGVTRIFLLLFFSRFSALIFGSTGVVLGPRALQWCEIFI